MLNPYIFCFENSVDSDQLASKPADQDLHCFLFCYKWNPVSKEDKIG